jgi:hypothetical protein
MRRRRFLLLAALTALASGLPLHSRAVPIFTKGNVLVGANFNDGPGSSDMTLIIKLESGAKIYVDEGAKVKYITNDANKDAKPGWTQIEYDDSKWLDGISGVGFSDNDDNTVTAAGLISIWTRYYFDIPDASTVKDLLLYADFDDHCGIWLNGERVFASNGLTPPTGEPAWNASAGGAAPNHESSDQAAGKPNKARWDHAAVVKTALTAKYTGVSALAVQPKGKLAAKWGDLKIKR